MLLTKKEALNVKREKKNGSNEYEKETQYYKAKSLNQKIYTEYLKNEKIKLVLAIGPAGTGKTLLGCNIGIQGLKNGKYKKLIITRPVVCVEEDIGYLPGSLEDKMAPWTRPILDIFEEFYSARDIGGMIENNIIEISPLGYMRGRTFKNAYIIADEMQNSSPNQMLMLATRIGTGSKMVITGDLNQSDLGKPSGLEDLIKRLDMYKKKGHELKEEGIEMIELNNTDIKREAIIATILDIYKN